MAEIVKDLVLDSGDLGDGLLSFSLISHAVGQLDQKVGNAGAGAEYYQLGFGIGSYNPHAVQHGIGICNAGTAEFGNAEIAHDILLINTGPDMRRILKRPSCRQ